jgi:hypothetical protein
MMMWATVQSVSSVVLSEPSYSTVVVVSSAVAFSSSTEDEEANRKDEWASSWEK